DVVRRQRGRRFPEQRAPLVALPAAFVLRVVEPLPEELELEVPEPELVEERRDVRERPRLEDVLEVGVPETDPAEPDPRGLLAPVAQVEQAPLAAVMDVHRPRGRPVEAEDVVRHPRKLTLGLPSRQWDSFGVADYVVVGAGAAGCVLASRLSEDPDVTVQLLEAGGPDTEAALHVPAMFPLAFKSDLDWDLLGEPEPGLGGRRLYLPRGRVIGGSSSINAMIYLRGNRLDFDDWAAGGATGWSYDEVLPYFKRSEDNERGENEFHGVGGPLAVSDSRAMTPLIDAQLEAAVQAGYELIDDLNVDRPEGVSRFQLTQRNGMRCSAADAFLHPAEERQNLEVSTGGFVERIVFEGERAVGVA